MAEEEKERIVALARKEERYIGSQMVYMVRQYMKHHIEIEPKRKVELPANWEVIET